MKKIDITREEEKISNDEAAYLFGYLRKKYLNTESVHGLDIILNSLSFALLRMIHLHVRPEDHYMMVEIINQILSHGIKEDEKK